MTVEITDGLKTGAWVRVEPCAYDLSPAWEGEVVRYWRNDAWIVRELEHNTECAYDAARLVVL